MGGEPNKAVSYNLKTGRETPYESYPELSPEDLEAEIRRLKDITTNDPELKTKEGQRAARLLAWLNKI